MVKVENILQNKLVQQIAIGVYRLEDIFEDRAALEFVKNKYLNALERDELENIPLNQQKKWILGRVCIKDAVCFELQKELDIKLLPAEIYVKKSELGAPYVIGQYTNLPSIKVSLSHKQEIYISTVSLTHSTGVDIEEIVERKEGFARLSFHPEEISLIPNAMSRSEWFARLWTAKEAYGKSLGVGLIGNPKRYKVIKVDSKYHVWIENIKIKSVKINKYIVSWI